MDAIDSRWNVRIHSGVKDAIQIKIIEDNTFRNNQCDNTSFTQK